jgi:O-antigen/teichoic acid export membrane protein
VPWWAILYLILLGLTGLFAAREDFRGGKSGWAIAEVLSTALAATFIIAVWHPGGRTSLGPAVVPLFLAFLTWETVSAVHDIKNAEFDVALTTRKNAIGKWVGVAMGLLLLAPAVVAGGYLAWHAL